MKKIKCIVLLATYNGEKYIRKQLDSILNQNNVDLKVIVSDDMSTDLTMDIIESYSDSRIIFLPSGKKFGSASQNFFRLIRDTNFEDCEFIAFADQDDIWNSNKMNIAINTINTKLVDAYSSNVIAFWEYGREVVIDKAQPEKKYDHLFSSAGPGCTYVLKKELVLNFKKELVKQRELTKDIELHDWLIYSFARSNNYKWYVDKNITIRYRQHSNNEFGANFGLKAFKDRWRKARNGWYRTQILKTTEFCDIDNDIVKNLRRNSYLNRLNLLKNIFQFRKRKREAFFLGLTFLIPGFK